MDPLTMTVVPEDGETLGEVMFRGNIVMKGYLKNKAATEEAFEGGWFHSGDLGVLYPDGYIQLKDRSKDIIISGGENISSIEVEDVLYKHPAVACCAVVAKPDEKWGETPCAFVELRPGASVTEEELIAWCREGLARYKCPRHIVFTEVPRTSTGKIQKFKLREMAKVAWRSVMRPTCSVHKSAHTMRKLTRDGERGLALRWPLGSFPVGLRTRDRSDDRARSKGGRLPGTLLCERPASRELGRTLVVRLVAGEARDLVFKLEFFQLQSVDFQVVRAGTGDLLFNSTLQMLVLLR